MYVLHKRVLLRTQRLTNAFLTRFGICGKAIDSNTRKRFHVISGQFVRSINLRRKTNFQ